MRLLLIFILSFQFSFARAEMFQQCLDASGSNIQELQKLGQVYDEQSLAECFGVPDSSVSSLFKDKNTTFWGQEMVGADLVQQRIKDKKIKLNTVQVGILDTLWNFNNIKGERTLSSDKSSFIEGSILMSHGDKVLNTLSSKNSKGIASSAHPVLFQFGRKPDTQNHPVDIMNISGGSNKDPSELVGGPQNFKNLLQSTPVFMSSGNKPPGSLGAVYGEYASNPNLILVGANEPSGLATYYSQQHEAVQVLAPAGSLVLNTAIKPDYGDIFDGTSASAPIVSGAFSDFFGLAGKVDGPEIRKLLRETSQPSPMVFIPKEKDKSGVGILNHYKLFRVAERLKEKKDWPKNRNLLQDPALYDFKKEALELEDSALELLKNQDCEKKQIGFKQLREAFLLNPTERNRFFLSYLNRQFGFEDTANFYWTDSNDKLLGTFIKETADAYKMNRFGKSRYEYQKFAPEAYTEAIKKAFPKDEVIGQTPAILISGKDFTMTIDAENFLTSLNKFIESEEANLKSKLSTDQKKYKNMITTQTCVKQCLKDSACVKDKLYLQWKTGLDLDCQNALIEYAQKNVDMIEPAILRTMSISILKQLGSN